MTAGPAVSPPSDEAALVRLLLAMTAVTGTIDAVSILRLGHVFVANMTGNVVFLAFGLAGASGFSISGSLVALGAFLVGAGAGRRLFGEAPRRLAMLGHVAATEAALCAAAAAISAAATATVARYSTTVLLALAMGAQNAVARRLAVADLTTTVLTLTVTGLAADRLDLRATNSHTKRRVAAVAAVAAMLVGGSAGALVVLHVSTAAALAAAVVVLLTVAGVARFSRPNEDERRLSCAPMSSRRRRRRIRCRSSFCEGAAMPTPDTPSIGSPCWVDLLTSDTDGSRTFYGQLFGWASEEPAEEFGGYFSFTQRGARVAGCMHRQPDTVGADVWSVYLVSDDAHKTVDTATANGGQVVVPPMAVGDLGTMAVVSDEGGAAIGVWQPGVFPGFGMLREHGTPSWFELHARDYTAAVAFYRNVFRWETHVASDTPELRYTVLVDGEDWRAGIMDAAGFLPEGYPPCWSVYFGVDDTDASLAKVVDLGGSIVTAAEDTPYGRIAVAADPTGAQFKLVSPNAAMPAAG